MRAILLLLTSLIGVVAVFAAGMAFTAYLIAEPEPHRFAHLDTPDLWTSKPVVVNGGEQTYERIAPVPAVASLPPSKAPEQDLAAAAASLDDSEQSAPGIDNTQTGSVSNETMPAEEQRPVAALDPAHAEWCFSRYRSYRANDNSYQPFGGGPRRQCESPWTPMPEDMAASAEAVTTEGGSPAALTQQASIAGEPSAGTHQGWCLQRYRSYRIEDNTYQPFDGGPRRACASPYR